MLDPLKIQDFLRGMNKFYNKFERKDIKQKVIWQEGSTSVLDFSLDSDLKLPILFFIPSLINKSYIFDLAPEASMVRYFAQLGYRVYLLDFAEPLDNESMFGFLDYRDRISKSICEICIDFPLITIGYCLGGVFSGAIASLRNHNIIKQVLIATPWNLLHLSKIFALDNPLIAHNFQAMLSSCNKISPTIIQYWFSTLDPSRIWQKFCNFSNMEKEEDVNRFMAIEQWINDGISLTRAFALECLSMLANEDLANEKFFTLNTKIPCLAIAGSEDKIVPLSSCLPLYNLMLDRKLLIANTGHIGLVAGRLAKEKTWQKIFSWINLPIHQ